MPVIEVAAGVIRHPENSDCFFITRRMPGQHLAGCWEFPGGKIEPGEQVEDALKRELQEELGIDITKVRPLIEIRHDYVEKSVCLKFYEVLGFDGEPHGREGQEARWVELDELSSLEFPEANRSVVKALQLPERLLITPEFDWDQREEFVGRFQHRMQTGDIGLVQFRAHHLEDERYFRIARRLQVISLEMGAKLLLNRSPTVEAGSFEDWHLSSSQLMSRAIRPDEVTGLLSASCHNLEELVQAAAIGCDFVLLSNVLPTASHSGREGLGWNRFMDLARKINLPVYALGGVAYDDLNLARKYGAYGVAGIRDFWALQTAMRK